MKKLTPEVMSMIRGKIEQSKNNMESRHKLWRTILDEYCMRNYDSLRSALSGMESDFATADFMASNGRVPYVNLYVRKMLGMVVPKNNEYVLRAHKPDQEVITSVLDFSLESLVDKIDFEDKVGEVGMWALMLGTGIGKVGYTSELAYGQEAWSASTPVDKDSIPEQELKLPYRVTTERTAATDSGNPIFKAIPSFDYFKDAASRTDEEIQWEFVRFRRLLSDAKMDQRYTKAGREQLTGFTSQLSSGNAFDDWNLDYSQDDDDTLYCYVWEVIHIPSGQWCVIGETGSDPLIDWTPLRLPKGMTSPYLKCRLIPALNSFWGISYAALLLPSVIAMNITKAQTISQISRDGKKVIGYDPATLGNDADTKTRIQQAGHMEMVAIPNLSTGKAIEVIDFGGTNPALVNLQNMFGNDLATISQLTDQTRNAASSESTATEAQIRNSQQQISVGDLRGQFNSFHKQAVKAICRIMLKEWPQSKLIKVMGADPRVYFWINVDKDKISEDFDVSIMMGMSEEGDRTIMRRQLSELAPQVMQIGDRIVQQQAMQQQNPNFRPSVNWEGFLELLLDQYDPKFKNKILQKKDPLSMVIELVQTKGMQQLQMSPMLMEQVKTYLNSTNQAQLAAQFTAEGGGVTPENNGTLNNNGGAPFPAKGTPTYAGTAMTDAPAFQSGRAASEAMS